MGDQEQIKQAFERNAAILEKRPSAAKITSAMTVRSIRGLTCEIEQGAWTFKADQPKANGGNKEGPGPGFFGRAALGICVAQGYVMWFAKKGVPLNGIEVKVEARMDTRGMFGVSEGVPPGYAEMRYTVEIDSDASEDEIMAVLDIADKHSPWLYNFTTPINVSRQVIIR